MMKTAHDVRRVIIRDWMSLPPEKRATAAQATGFATKTGETNEFQCSGDRGETILKWVLPRIGKK
jgi:hypothetical protein